MYQGWMHRSKIFHIMVGLIDGICILGGYILVFWVKFGNQIPDKNIVAFIQTIPYICIIAVLLLYIYGMYSLGQKSVGEIIFSIALVCIILGIISMATAFFFRGFAFPRTIIVFGAVVQFLLLSVWRCLLWKTIRKIIPVKRIMLIAGGTQLEVLAGKIMSSHEGRFDVHYMVDYNNDINDILPFIEKVQGVIIGSGIDERKKSIILSQCLTNNKEIYIVPSFYDISVKDAALYQLDDILTFRVGDFQLYHEQRAIKRCFDVLFSLVGIILTAPIMIMISILIKCSSKGKILYKQERVTQQDKVFNIYKFRTMIENAEDVTGPTLSTKEDPRITRLGMILRTSHLDELPQLFNVLFGHMSIVGPRPERPCFVEQYKRDIPHYQYRFVVKAGITGLAQAVGKYSTTTVEKLRYDLMYIRNYSFLLDIRLILQTLKIMFIKEVSEGIQEKSNLKEAVDHMGYRYDINMEKEPIHSSSTEERKCI